MARQRDGGTAGGQAARERGTGRRDWQVTPKSDEPKALRCSVVLVRIETSLLFRAGGVSCGGGNGFVHGGRTLGRPEVRPDAPLNPGVQR